ncbi:hypothetical protein EDD21DRAFT_353625 [Dissophora ornata]|nr:hypothetical protein EDD21DRAFT_353625 [Dissophora ornata]
MQKRSDQGKWTARSTMTEIEKALTQIFVLTPGDKQCLGKSLAGILQVCHCATAAEICISKVLKSSQDPSRHIVVSGDPDLLIHKDIPRVFQPIPRSNEFAIYTKIQAAQRLSLPGPDHLTLLGVVQKNYCSPNVFGLGMATNLRIIRQIPKIRDMNRMLQCYLTRAQQLTQEKLIPTRFDVSKRIFVDHVATPLLVGSSPSTSSSSSAPASATASASASKSPSLTTNVCFIQREVKFQQLKRLRAQLRHQQRR